MNVNRLLLGSVLGLLFLVMGASLFMLIRENKALKEGAAESQQIIFEEKNTTAESKEPNEKESAKPPPSAKALFVEGVFQQFLPYTEETYLSRFDGVADKLDAEVLAQLKDMVATLEPGITVQNSLHDLAVYTNGTDANQFLVVALVSLRVGEGVDSAYTQVYQATVTPGDPYKINGIASLGSIAPFDRE